MSTTPPTTAQPETAVQQSTPAATPAAAAPASGAAPTDPRAGFLSELKRFNDNFGADGATWLSEGKSFEQAALLHIEALKADQAAKQTEITDLKGKLASAPRGEEAALSFSSGDKAPPAAAPGSNGSKLSHLGPIGAFAQSIRMPGAAK